MWEYADLYEIAVSSLHTCKKLGCPSDFSRLCLQISTKQIMRNKSTPKQTQEILSFYKEIKARRGIFRQHKLPCGDISVFQRGDKKSG